MATLTTGLFGEWFYERLLRVIARREARGLSISDRRTTLGRCFDKVLSVLGVTNLVIARGASYWLIVEQTAKLIADKEPEVYADVTQGDDSTLFAGQVAQVITSRSGETHSVVLKKARRYRRNTYGPTDPATGEASILKAGGWKKIGDSEASYLRGDTVQNISYRIYGDPMRGGYRRSTHDGLTWTIPEFLVEALKRRSTVVRGARVHRDPPGPASSSASAP